jgi:hypothetical protein
MSEEKGTKKLHKEILKQFISSEFVLLAHYIKCAQIFLLFGNSIQTYKYANFTALCCPIPHFARS